MNEAGGRDEPGPVDDAAQDINVQAPQPAQDAETDTAAPTADGAQLAEELVFALACAGCRGEKFVLCLAADLLEDDANKNPGVCV
jgi:hypothetical protein